MVKPRPKSSDAAPLKLDYSSVVSTVTLNLRCKIFVLSTDVTKCFYHLKRKSKSRPFKLFLLWQIYFLDSVDKIKPFFLFQSGLIKESKTVRRHSLILPLSVGLSVARCFVRTKSDWPNLTGLDPATIKFYRVIYSRHSHGYFVLLKYCLVRYLRKYSLLELDVIMLASN